MRLLPVYLAILLSAAVLGGGMESREPSRALPQSTADARTDEAGKSIVWARPNRHNSDVILLVHGWNGDRLDTWSQLLLLLHADETLAQYDIASFAYPSGCGASYPGIDEVARELDEFVRNNLKRYDRVHIVGYSLGGLVARRYIVDVLKQRGRGALNVEHLVLIAVPNEGAREVLTAVGSTICGDQVAQAELKLLAALPADWQKEAKRISTRFHLDPAGWFQPGYVHAHLKSVAECVWAERKISVRYESWTKVTDRVLEPYGLVLKGGIWYVVARSGDDVRTFRLSGIQALIVLEETFSRPRDFDLAEYWAQATVQFERDIYVGTATVRATQKGVSRLRGISDTVKKAIDTATLAYDEAGWATLTIPIEEVGWATREMTNAGAEVEVLEPPELRRAVADVARKMAAFYG